MALKDASRFTAGRKAEAVLRLLRGEEPAAVAGEAALPVSELLRWKDVFVQSGTRALDDRAYDEATEETGAMAPAFTLDAVPTMAPFGFELLTAKLDVLMTQWKREAKR
jgi:hypothetical protein